MRRSEAALMVAAALAGGLCLVQIASWLRAEADLIQSRESMLALKAAGAEIKSLRERQALISEKPMPNERFVGMASEVAAQASLAANAIKSVEAEQQSAGPTATAGAGTSLRKQSVRVAMDAISLPELGSFLGVWRSLHPSWTPTRIDLSPAQLSSINNHSTASVPKWNVRLAFTSVYLPE